MSLNVILVEQFSAVFLKPLKPRRRSSVLSASPKILDESCPFPGNQQVLLETDHHLVVILVSVEHEHQLRVSCSNVRYEVSESKTNLLEVSPEAITALQDGFLDNSSNTAVVRVFIEGYG